MKIIKWLMSEGGYIKTSDFTFQWTNLWNLIFIGGIVYLIWRSND